MVACLRPACIKSSRAVLFTTGAFTEANYSCIFPLTNLPLQQKFILCQHLLSSLKPTPNHSDLCFYRKKKLEDGIFEMPMRKIWKRNSYFCKSAYEPIHIFWWVELPAMHARQVLDLICVPWASSAPNPPARKKRSRTTFTLVKGQQKAVQLCMQTWISLWKWNPLFTAKFHLQLLVIKADMFVLPSQSCKLFFAS